MLIRQGGKNEHQLIYKRIWGTITNSVNHQISPSYSDANQGMKYSKMSTHPAYYKVC